MVRMLCPMGANGGIHQRWLQFAGLPVFFRIVRHFREKPAPFKLPQQFMDGTDLAVRKLIQLPVKQRAQFLRIELCRGVHGTKDGTQATSSQAGSKVLSPSHFTFLQAHSLDASRTQITDAPVYWVLSSAPSASGAGSAMGGRLLMRSSTRTPRSMVSSTRKTREGELRRITRL